MKTKTSSMKKHTMALKKKKNHSVFHVMMMPLGACLGTKLEKLFKMTNFDRDESVMKFARQLRSMGVDEQLRAAGARDGDLVRIEKFEFEFVD